MSVPFQAETRKPSLMNYLKVKAESTIKLTKWMLLTLMAPEYILGKALAENFAARYSRKEFSHKSWTITHGYFANMRGLILRFDVAAVPTSLKPSKAGDLGRSLQKPRADGNPPYYEQDAGRSMAIELDQCNKICGIPCRNRPDVKAVCGSDIESSYQPSQKVPSTQHDGIVELQELQVGGGRSGADTLLDANTQSRVLNELAENEPRATGRRVASDSLTSISEMRQDETANSSIGLEETRNGNTIPTRGKPTLGPHKTWKATWALSANQWFYAYQTGIIINPPEVTAEELGDRSKGDALVNAAAVFQVTWLAAQIVARAFQNLAITLLEVTVLAFAACAMITYIAFWNKPKDVEVPVYIDIPNVLTREQIIGLAARSPVSSIIVHEFWLHGVAIRAIADNIFPTSLGIPLRLPFVKDTIYVNPGLFGMAFGGSLFGAVHFSAWNFEFPTMVEKIMWRVSCIILVLMPPVSIFIYWMTLHIARRWGTTDNKVNKLFKPLEYMFVPFYFFARVFLLIEVFRSLAYLPPSAFQEVEWPSAIPHVS